MAEATYEDLAELEREFEDAEVEIIRQQCALTKPLYEKREQLISKIQNFWPLVIEHAPQDVDQYIQPSDASALYHLTSVSVSHFEIEDGGKGDPRSIAIKMEFRENKYFEDKVLEKKFWYRRSRDGYAGLVSEPVPIKWKPKMDLTQGLLPLAIQVWEEGKNQDTANGTGKKKRWTKAGDFTAKQRSLRQMISTFAGASFFCWFGYRGENISAEESTIAVEEDNKRRADKAAGKQLEEEEEEDESEDEGNEDDSRVLEIFPDGGELAVTISEDLVPNAIKYFTEAQEEDVMSDSDFEEGDDDNDVEEQDDDDDDNGDEAPPLKRVKV